MKTRYRFFVGTIELGNEIIVSDPCYARDSYANDILTNVKVGKWDVESYKADDSFDGHILLVTARGYKLGVMPKQKLFIGGIDSGQAGVYNIDEYNNDDLVSLFKHNNVPNHLDLDEWYGYACHISEDGVPAKLVGNGVTSESGYGDGVYTTYIDTNTKGEIVRIVLVF